MAGARGPLPINQLGLSTRVFGRGKRARTRPRGHEGTWGAVNRAGEGIADSPLRTTFRRFVR
jgi:hypothetical protein